MNSLFKRRWIFAGALLLGGCAQNAASPPQSSAPAAKIEAMPSDDLGREIALKTPAQRAIIIGPGAIETVFFLGAQKSLVGRDSIANFPAEAKKIAVAGDFKGPNIEVCASLRPDLIIVQGETWDKTRVDDWQSKIGAPVAALTPTSLEKLARDTEKIGAWFGKKAPAKTLAARFDALEKNENPSGPTVLAETGRSPLWVAGANTFIGDAIQKAGGRNAATELGVKGYQQLSGEVLLAKQPDFYLATSQKSRAQELANLRSNALLSQLKCVKNGKIAVIDGDLILRPGPRLLMGIAKLKEELKTIQNK